MLKMMIRKVVRIVSGFCNRIIGLNSIFIEMKNSIVKVLCSGNEFFVVLWLSLDLLRIILVKKVFSVKDILNSIVEL